MPILEVHERRGTRPFGFTLLEVMVVLILLGLASALVTPAFLQPPSREKDELQTVIDAARSMAIRNASTVTLSFTADGRWTAEESNGRGLADMSGGTLTARGTVAVRLLVSPLGGCALEGAVAGETTVTFDPVHCRLRTD